MVAPSRRTTSVEIPASAGEQGPGEMMMCDGRHRGDLVDREGVVPADHRRLAQLADVAGQVVDEGVVVVDQEDHGPRQRADQRPRLVQRLPVLQLGIGVGDDAAARLEVYPPPRAR